MISWYSAIRRKLFAKLRHSARAIGFDVVRYPSIPPGVDDFSRAVIERVRPYTMTSPERVLAAIESVRHVHRAGLGGAVVECGVWRGGSVMAMALTMLEIDSIRDIHLFDTFEGMTAPGDKDVDSAGVSAADRLAAEERAVSDSVWCVASEADVRQNLASTGYPMERVFFHRGPVEQTLPDMAPSRIALLRLDTDWYESTRHELIHLYPRLCSGGVLIVDDYGAWQGASAAVDEYFLTMRTPPMLVRIDETGRLCIKPE